MQQLSLFDFVEDVKPTIELAELFEAYADCRSNKRNTLNALAFELDYETNLLKLCAEINDGRYQPVHCLYCQQTGQTGNIRRRLSRPGGASSDHQ